MNRPLAALVLALACAAAFAAVVPSGGQTRDLTKIPDPTAREQELAALPISLVQAIETASKDGGVVSSAAFSRDGQIELTLVHGGAEHALVVDSKTGAVVSKNELPLFPGAPVSGAPTTLPNGLRYYDLKVGDGAEAIAKTSSVMMHYTGWLLDGFEFDSSIPRQQAYPVNLAAPRVIQGWSEGIPGMKVGGKRKLVVPANLGYGQGGNPSGKIPPNAVLVFDVELVKVQ